MGTTGPQGEQGVQGEPGTTPDINENFKPIRLVVKSENETRSISTEMSDDSELIVPLSYFCTYIVDGCIYFKTNNDANSQFAFFPADARDDIPEDIPADCEWDSIQAYMDLGVSCGDAVTQNNLVWDYCESTVKSTTVLVDGEMTGVIFVKGIITIEMGLEFGQPALLFRWAQNTSSIYETQVLAGSYLSVTCVDGDDDLKSWKIDVIE